MTKKEYLRQGYKIRMSIKNEEEVLKELGENLAGLQALHNSEKLQGGPVKDDSKFIEKVDKIIRIEQEIYRKIGELKAFQAKLYQEIEMLKEPTEQILMRSRYILNLTWEEIAERIGYSVMQTHRIHKKALENFRFF